LARPSIVDTTTTSALFRPGLTLEKSTTARLELDHGRQNEPRPTAPSPKPWTAADHVLRRLGTVVAAILGMVLAAMIGCCANGTAARTMMMRKEGSLAVVPRAASPRVPSEPSPPALAMMEGGADPMAVTRVAPLIITMVVAVTSSISMLLLTAAWPKTLS
jgi:hypothetical protein